MDRYLQQMQHHKFLDPDPAAVEGDYVRYAVLVCPMHRAHKHARNLVHPLGSPPIMHPITIP